MTEERYRTAVQFSFAANTTLTRAQTSTVKLGTTVGNTGLEGISYDPVTAGYLLVNEAAGSGAAQNIFQTQIDFTTGIASNGSATTVNATSLFPASNVGLGSFNDVFALANVYGSSAVGYQNILVLSLGGIKEMTRGGVVVGSLTLPNSTTNPREGITMDNTGRIYVVTDNGNTGTVSSLLVYEVAAVPEPAGYGLAFAGLGMLGFVARRKKAAWPCTLA